MSEITAADQQAAKPLIIRVMIDELTVEQIQEALAKHRIQARKDALGEAAKVADDNRTDDGRMWDRAAETIATAIRASKEG